VLGLMRSFRRTLGSDDRDQVFLGICWAECLEGTLPFCQLVSLYLAALITIDVLCLTRNVVLSRQKEVTFVAELM
jgi:hypothetical protein